MAESDPRHQQMRDQEFCGAANDGRGTVQADRSREPTASPQPLARLGGARPPAPAWFEAARTAPCERVPLSVEGCVIELLCWGARGRPGILLLHGAMAHAGWWIAIAPLLAADYRVCALSFSGMGGSGHRDRYSVSLMAEEGWAASQAGGLFDGPAAPIVVAHSFGGKAAALMAHDGRASLLGTIFVDSFILPGELLGQPPPYKTRLYPSEAEAITRFRLSPSQPVTDLFVVDEIARIAVRPMAGGVWTWRFDPEFFNRLDYRSGWDEAIASRCPLAFVRGGLSTVVTQAGQDTQRRAMRPDTIFVEVPEAHHHIMIDQPLALVAALRAIAAGWTAEEHAPGARHDGQDRCQGEDFR